MTALHPDVSGIAVDVRLFHEAWCYLVHKYRVYKDPLTHPALGGGGVPARLLSFVGWAMAIAQLTHLHISIPASGAPGYPAASGRLFDGDESGHPGSSMPSR